MRCTIRAHGRQDCAHCMALCRVPCCYCYCALKDPWLPLNCRCMCAGARLIASYAEAKRCAVTQLFVMQVICRVLFGLFATVYTACKAKKHRCHSGGSATAHVERWYTASGCVCSHSASKMAAVCSTLHSAQSGPRLPGPAGSRQLGL